MSERRISRRWARVREPCPVTLLYLFSCLSQEGICKDRRINGLVSATQVVAWQVPWQPEQRRPERWPTWATFQVWW